MVKIKDLIQFEEVKEVIQINAIGNPREIVEKYVISENIRDSLIELFLQLRQNKHRSVNIVGNYGTGKSHLLAFISLVLQQPGLRAFVQSSDVRKALDALDRQYTVVQIELPATQKVSLAEIFYDQLQKQLKEKYGVDTPEFDIRRDWDHKKFLEEVVASVKRKDPNLGVCAIIDEISDFMKQKTREDMSYDMQFLRQLGEASQNTDFIFIGSMQEHVFTNPKYTAQAETIARVQERFQVVTITREEIKKVIASRVVRKSSSQEEAVRELFTPLRGHFTNLISEEETYVQLYPVHPYVIEIFSQLPYFEHRGIISFVVGEVRKILEAEFPIQITYDRIYDLIARTHAIRNLDEVKPIIDAVSTLESKIDLLDKRLRGKATNLVKALAVLRLSRESGGNGATAQELANTLFIQPDTQVIDATDNVELILKKLRDITDGQFIKRSPEGLYLIDLKAKVDFDVRIRNEMQNLPEAAGERELETLLIDKLDISEPGKNGVFEDSTIWKSRNAFREGWLIIETRKVKRIELEGGDYQFHILSHFRNRSDFAPREGRVVVNPNWDEETILAFNKVAAIRQLINQNYYKDVMTKKLEEAYQDSEKKLISCIIKNGTIDFARAKKVATIVDSSSSVDALLSLLKSELLENHFGTLYPKHPAYEVKITQQNVRGTVESIIKDMCSRPTMSGFTSQTLALLRSLGLAEGNSVDTDNSEFAKKVLTMLIAASGKNVAVSEIIGELAKPPYGLENGISLLLLSTLLLTGELIFVEKGGRRVYASDFPEIFKKDLSYFDNVKYIVLEEEVPIQFVSSLFDALHLQKALLRNKATYPEAVRVFSEAVVKARGSLSEVNEVAERLRDDKFLQIGEVQSALQAISTIPILSLAKVRSISDFKRLDLSRDDIESIKKNYSLLEQLALAFRDYSEEIRKGLRYMEEAARISNENPSVFSPKDNQELRTLFDESLGTVGNLKRFLQEDERRPIKGKIQQFKRRYSQLYFNAHEQTVGRMAPWSDLQELIDSETYHKVHRLSAVKCINVTPFTEVAFQIHGLRQRRCDTLSIDDLDGVPQCTRCQFPRDIPLGRNLGRELNSLRERIEAIDKMWEKQIFSEIEKNLDQIKLLKPAEQMIIRNLKSGRKFDRVDEGTIRALNSLFEKLDVIDVKLTELFKFMTKESDVLTLDEMDRRYQDFKTQIIGTVDTEHLRLRLVREKSDGSDSSS